MFPWILVSSLIYDVKVRQTEAPHGCEEVCHTWMIVRQIFADSHQLQKEGEKHKILSVISLEWGGTVAAFL